MDEKHIKFSPLSFLLKQLPQEKVQNLLSTFSCSKEPDVEKFLKESSIEFEKRDRSRTYLWIDISKGKVVAYFSIAVDVLSLKGLSKSKQKRLNKGFSPNEEYIFTYLIGQIGRSDCYSNEVLKGEKIIQTALAKIKEAKQVIGGRLVVIDIQNVINKKSLEKFYLDQGFGKLKNISESLTRYYLILK